MTHRLETLRSQVAAERTAIGFIKAEIRKLQTKIKKEEMKIEKRKEKIADLKIRISSVNSRFDKELFLHHIREGHTKLMACAAQRISYYLPDRHARRDPDFAKRWSNCKEIAARRKKDDVVPSAL